MRGALLLLLSLLSFCWSEPALEEALLELPKLELHAHIHGSLRRSTMVELASQLNMTAGMKVSLDKYDHGVADKPFELFPIVHAIVSSKEVVTRIVTEIIEDYQSQNCIYLELRTTPRALRDGTTMEEYLRTVLDVISAYNAQRRDQMLVKLVVSIDRSKRYSEAVEALELAKKLAMRGDERLIVGIDFSGNPLGGRFEDFRPVLEDARSFGFNLTIHTAEARALSEPPPETDGADETSAILAFRPDRIGHLLYAQERHFQQVRRREIKIKIKIKLKKEKEIVGRKYPPLPGLPSAAAAHPLLIFLVPLLSAAGGPQGDGAGPAGGDLPHDGLLPAGPDVLRQPPALPPPGCAAPASVGQHGRQRRLLDEPDGRALARDAGFRPGPRGGARPASERAGLRLRDGRGAGAAAGELLEAGGGAGGGPARPRPAPRPAGPPDRSRRRGRGRHVPPLHHVDAELGRTCAG